MPGQRFAPTRQAGAQGDVDVGQVVALVIAVVTGLALVLAKVLALLLALLLASLLAMGLVSDGRLDRVISVTGVLSILVGDR